MTSTSEDIDNFVKEFSRAGDTGEQKAALYNAISELVLDALERDWPEQERECARRRYDKNFHAILRRILPQKRND